MIFTYIDLQAMLISRCLVAHDIKFSIGVPNIFGFLNMKLASYHSRVAKNFELAPTFVGNLYTSDFDVIPRQQLLSLIVTGLCAQIICKTS